MSKNRKKKRPAWKRALAKGLRMTPLAKSRAPKGGAVKSRYDKLPPLPPAPPEWPTGPDFIIIGAQKSGTTWWQGLVESHASVYRARQRRRELHFFDHFWDRWPTPEQFDRYKHYFPRPENSIVGEKTPGYLYQPWVPPMLKEVVPEAKFIVIMRDPVERYISNLGLLKRSGALKGEVGAGEIGAREHRIVEAMERSRYATQLSWWFEHFPRDQFLLLQYEQCVADTQTQLARTHEFLGLTPQPASIQEIKRARKKAADHVSLPSSSRAWLAEYFTDDVQRLREVMPDLDVSLWKSLDLED